MSATGRGAPAPSRLAAVTVSVAAVVAGFLVSAQAAAAATSSPTPAAGARKSATRLNFGVSGTAGLSVDVATGNALFTDQLLTLPGVTGDVPISLYYNSSAYNSSVPSSVTNSDGSGWGITGFDQRLVTNAADGSVTYYGPGGLSGVFTANGTSFVSPAQFQATLATVSGGGWTLSDHGSGSKLTFTADGRLSTVADRNGNLTTFTLDPYDFPAKVVSSRGATVNRTLTVQTSSYRITGLTQTSGSLTRTVSLAYTPNHHLGSVTDSVGGVTQFASAAGTDTGQVVTVTNPDGATTSLTSTSGKVTQVAQSNTATGSPGTSTTRLTYPSATQTLVADPTTDQASAVSAVPHTTYTLTGDELVASATDPDGHARAATYTSLGSVASATPAAGGATTYTYGANNGESLTSIKQASGATASASYSNTGASQYLPSSATDDAGNAYNYTYNGAGNSLTTAQGVGPQAKVTLNSDGTVATSQAPGAATGVQTSYAYTSGQRTSMTPPSGTSLAGRTYTYDGFGRLATATDGRGNTTTYGYDDADRITSVNYSDAATTDVTYGYDSEGRVAHRVDGSGTTTYTWDALGRLLSVANTAGGGTISYRYDLAGALTSTTDSRGTIGYGYDAAHQLTSMTYPRSGGTNTTRFANDANGRRTDTWLQANTGHTTWTAHSHTTYDSSGRVTAVTGDQGSGDTSYTRVVNQTTCYAAGATAPTCPTTTTADRSKIRWVTDAISGETSTYSYDTHGRLTSDAITGGSNPRTFSFTYDAAGNRLTSAVTGTSPTSQTLTFNAGNQITSTGYSYDAAGNRTSSPGYTSTYNTAGQRTSATKAGVTTSYTYAGTSQNEVLTETTPNADAYSLTYGRTDQSGLPVIEQVHVNGATGYVDHDPTGAPVMLQTSTGTACLYIYDGRSNPVALVTDGAYQAFAETYDPYGAATYTANSGGSGAIQNPYTYAGGTQDRVTGLIKYGHRWYDTTTGTFTQQDTLNAPLDPHNANRYTYAGDDPINNADPTGQGLFNDLLGLGVAAAGLGVAAFGVSTADPALAYAGLGLAAIGVAYSANAVNCDNGYGYGC